MDTGAELAPFHIEIEEAAVADLRHRLARTRWPDQLPDSAWALGTDVAYLRDLCEHWASGFDFDAFTARYNAHPQVRAHVDGTVVHAIVAAADAADATPLLLLHGWPSSVAEYRDVIEPLRARHHVVVASLPGYGFSGPTTQSGVGPLRIAGVLVELMRRLGYERFVVAGGDWGAIVGSWMAAHHPDAVAGLHVTLLPAAPVPGSEMMAGVTVDEQALLARSQRVMASGTGYQAIQSTKPQSIAYGLTDSPAGLAGWIIEKFHAWSDCDGDLASVYSPDRLLENISIYWFTGTINSSMRLYHEAMSAGRSPLPGVRVEVPTGHAAFPGEIYPTPRVWGDHWFNVTRWSVMERGGHFAAMEVPEVYAAEVAAFTADL
jgi:pimeloyl-ACP methyl ester carboxylesterase